MPRIPYAVWYQAAVVDMSSVGNRARNHTIHASVSARTQRFSVWCVFLLAQVDAAWIPRSNDTDFSAHTIVYCWWFLPLFIALMTFHLLVFLTPFSLLSLHQDSIYPVTLFSVCSQHLREPSGVLPIPPILEKRGTTEQRTFTGACTRVKHTHVTCYH